MLELDSLLGNEFVELEKQQIISLKELERSTVQMGETVYNSTFVHLLHNPGIYGKVLNHMKSCLGFAKRYSGDSANVWEKVL